MQKDKSAHLVRYFKRCFMSKLAAESGFWQFLQPKMQIEMLKCVFDMWLCNSSRALEMTLITSESIQENSDYVDSIRQALVSFELAATHFVCLLTERSHLEPIKVLNEETISTTKEMKKQLKKVRYRI